MTVGLKGHVMSPAFPEGYSNWQETDLHDLIDAELIKEPTDKNVVKAIRKLAKDADAVVIATDYDREGELIGLEALEEILEVNPGVVGANGESEAEALAARPPVKRARYSALTKEEIERAFSHLDDLSYDLAYAGAARQDIDLIWGATLTRAVSLATRRFGSNFLSVGRVQSPTLALIVERELERRAHVAEALLGGVRPLPASRRRRSRPTTRPTSSGRRPRPTPRSRGPSAPAWSRRSHRGGTRASRRRPTTPPPSPPTPRAGSGSRRRGRCGSPRTSTWTGSSPTRGPTTRSIRSRSTLASWSPRWSGSRSSRPRRRCSTAT